MATMCTYTSLINHQIRVSLHRDNFEIGLTSSLLEAKTIPTLTTFNLFNTPDTSHSNVYAALNDDSI